MRIKITAENTGRRLDKFLFAYMNNAPHSFIYRLIRTKKIKLNDASVDGNEILNEGDEIFLIITDAVLSTCRKPIIFPEAKPLNGILYEDENILVVNKIVGLVSHEDDTDEDDTLLARVLYYLQESGSFDPNAAFTPALCHRLDRNTSGIIICGKNLQAVKKITKLFATGKIKKEYLAVVCGNVGKIGESRILVNYLEKDPITNTAYVFETETSKRRRRVRKEIIEKNYKKIVYVNAEPRPRQKIITEFTVLAVAPQKNYSLLSVSPVTGRSHQIRAHLSFIGHPLAGDVKYRGHTALCGHHLLHCRRLKISKGFSICAPPPKKMKEIIRRVFNFDLSTI